jgi:hypothetical protein
MSEGTRTDNVFNSYSLNSYIQGLIFSIGTIFITSGIRIIDPRYIDWLSVGDGTAEISWEFFRKQPLFQLPIGINPSYGLEISSTFALDGQIPLFSLIFHPLSSILPERFQYLGIFIMATFALNYIFAKRIFNLLKFNEYQQIISSVILASSPIILNRLIENTHYSLISGWIIFAAIYLLLKSDLSLSQWILLYVYAILTHLYYLPFLVVMYVVAIAYSPKGEFSKIKGVVNFFVLLLTCGIVMLIAGYFYGGSSSKDVGYGLFRSTLLSLFDPSGWSSVIPDIDEPEGSYEGFGYIGITTFLLSIISLISYRKRKRNLEKLKFKSLWISAILLFIFSLSNNIAFGKFEIFSFKVPDVLLVIPESFRSTGRFIWLISFLFFIYFASSIQQRYSQRIFSIILTFILIVGLIDYFPQMQSQKKLKFQINYSSSLDNKAWNFISECYSKIRVYPPTVGVENYYDFVQVANRNNLGINTGRFGRVDQNAIRSAYDQMHNEFDSGIYREDSFYVFTNAEFVIPEIVNYQKNLSIHTLDDDSAYGELNGYTFIAPKLKKCSEGNTLKQAIRGFGAPENQIYRGEKLTFGKNLDTSKYILIGFSSLEDWGVWSVDEFSKINLNTENISIFNSITITAQDLALPSNIFTVSINDLVIGTCSFEVEFSNCTLPFEFKNLTTNIVSLSFSPKIIRSPKDLGISDDTRNLGFGLKNIYLS